MTIIDFLRLLRKHIVILLSMPLILASIVAFLTKNASLTFSSETTIYTGIASGTSVEIDKTFSYFANTTAFENLINVINSRETQQEVAILLLAQHLMLSEPDPRYLSGASFNYVRKITPPYILSLIVKKNNQSSELTKHSFEPITAMNKDSATIKNLQDDSDTTFSFSRLYAAKNGKSFPSSIDQSAFEQTVKNLTNMLKSSDTNFVYRLVNTDGPHYSVTKESELPSIKAERIGTSDLVKVKFTSDDPGICQQTLVFLTQVCIKNIKEIKENRSDAVIKYFEYQVSQATQKLKAGEDKLLNFNEDNKIINYYEQSKAVAVAKEALDVDLNNMKIRLAGSDAAIKRLEGKLEKQQIVQLKSLPLLEKRNELSQINLKIATAETTGDNNTLNVQNLATLKGSADKIKDELRDAVNDLYHFNNTTEGLPISSLLSDWIAQVMNYEETKAGITVLDKRIQDFQKTYDIFAPAGANLKRIERAISVSEQEYLELLHELNLARLKMQDIELSSNLKTVDEPFFPLEPNPGKRKLAIIGAALFGFIAIFASLLALEYFDDTLRNPKKAEKILKLLPLAIFPKIYLKTDVLNFPFVADRLLEMAVQRIELLRKIRPETSKPYQILIFSTITNEGKTVISRNLASQLKKLGNKVIVIRYTSEVSKSEEAKHNCAGNMIMPTDQFDNPQKFSVIQWLFGYPDTRVDFQSAFIRDNGSILSENEIFEYIINEEFHCSNTYTELLIKNGQTLTFVPDYVLIEIPPLLYYPYPVGLVASANLPVMVCRANRVWSIADQSAFENFSKIISCPPQFILNGVELKVIESVLGDLQKKRNWFRKVIKKVVRFQFYTSNVP